jgi:hypothetical protein
MEMHLGSDRRVFCGDKHTVKIARLSPRGFIEYATYVYKNRGVRGVVKAWKSDTPTSVSGLKWNLLRGIDANRRERRVSRNTEVIVPTRSLLAGIVNIQPTTSSIGVSGEEVVRLFSDNLSNPHYEVARLGHMLEDSSNFGIHEGVVKFRDGGSTGLENMLAGVDDISSIRRSLGAVTIKNSEH